MRYATIEEAQKMEFGVTGETRVIDGDTYEKLVDDESYAWACKYLDDNGDMVDWDYLTESWAKELGLI